MSQTFYVLMDVGFEYNDETYFRPGCGGGNPSKVFTSKKKAEEAALENNIKEFKRLIMSGDIRDYGYNLNEIISHKAFEEDLMYDEGIFMTVLGLTAEDWWDQSCNSKSLKTEVSQEQWEKLFNCFDLNFWTIVTVEKG